MCLTNRRTQSPAPVSLVKLGERLRELTLVVQVNNRDEVSSEPAGAKASIIDRIRALFAFLRAGIFHAVRNRNAVTSELVGPSFYVSELPAQIECSTKGGNLKWARETVTL